MYSVNIEPHLPGPRGSVTEFAFDVDEHYVAECRERGIVPGVGAAALPGPAAYDEFAMGLPGTDHGIAARDYPVHFSLSKQGNRRRWINRPLQIDQHFIFGDRGTLPREPLDYITRQAQGDFVVMDQREGDLWTEAGMVTTQADWSLDFEHRDDLQGMARTRAAGTHELQVFDRALKFLLNLRLGQPVRRLNWTMTIHPRLDTSPENYPTWGTDRATVTAQNAGDLVHLRVELQGLWRLPRSTTPSCSAFAAISSVCGNCRRCRSGRAAYIGCSATCIRR